MLVQSLFFAAALSATGLAVDLDDNEVPYQCRDVCSSIVKLTKDCDVANYGPNDDANELACICNAENSKTQIPLCEACVTQYDSDGADNDVNELVRKCGFAYATYNTAAPPPAYNTNMPPPISTKATGYGEPATPLKPATSAPAPGYGTTSAPPAAPSGGYGTGSAAPSPPPAAPTGGYGNATAPNESLTTTASGGAPAPSYGEPSGSPSSGAPAEQTGNVGAVNAVGVGMLGVGVLGWVVGVM